MLFGIPKTPRAVPKPTKIKATVETAKQIVARRVHLIVLLKTLSAMMPLKIAAKIIIMYVRMMVRTPLISSVRPHTALIYGVKYVVRVNIM